MSNGFQSDAFQGDAFQGGAFAGPSSPAAGKLGLVDGEGEDRGTGGGEYGPNMEKLPEELQHALRELVLGFEREDSEARRHEVREIREAREFWKGLQYGWWDEENQKFSSPTDFSIPGILSKNLKEDDLPQFRFVTNIFRAYGLILIAVLSQRIPKAKFHPQSAQQPQDVATAKTASKIADLIERNNNISKKQARLAWLLFCDGGAAAYVRYVSDKARFGAKQEPVIEQQPQEIMPAGYRCPACGTDTPQGDVFMGMCPDCGAKLGQENFMPAESVPLPVQTGMKEVPNGQEVIDYIGRLELKRPFNCREQHEMPYIQWQREIHKAKLKASFPWVADKIGAGGMAGSGTEAQYERNARLDLTGGTSGDSAVNKVTFTSTWLRPWAFYQLEDKDKRERLLKIFPDGCYVGFAADVYCEARNENMDECITLLDGMPGDGQSTPSLGQSLVSVQKRVNELMNILQETFEFGIASTIMDSTFRGPGNFKDQTAQPGMTYWVKMRPGERMQDKVFQMSPAQVGAELTTHLKELTGEIAQFVSGATPSLWGGELENNDTASGYAQAKEGALGRLGLTWREMKFFHAATLLNAVECFRKNRYDDVEIPLEGKSGEWHSDWIKQADLRGNLVAYPETDEDFPTLWSEIRAVVMSLLDSTDPGIQEVKSLPENADFIKRAIGLTELVFPGEDSRNKQYVEIDRMRGQQPIPMGVGPDGMPLFQSTIPIDGFVDDNAIEHETCIYWLNSEEGMATKDEDPMWWENVKAHAQAHEAQIMEDAIKEQIKAGPVGPPMSGSAGPPAGPTG